MNKLALLRFDVRDQIISCTRCELHSHCKTKIVDADGNTVITGGPVPFRGPTPTIEGESIQLAVVGEAPGNVETRDGLPFVGPAGQLLEELLITADIDPRKIFYCNSVSCQPKKKDPSTGQVIKNPLRVHINSCRKNLLDQLALANPNFLLLAGKIALQAFVSGTTISKEHGRPKWIHLPHREKGIAAVPIWHPAAYLHTQDASIKREILEDLRLLRAMMNAEGIVGMENAWTSACTGCRGEVDCYDESGRAWCVECSPGVFKEQVRRRKELLKGSAN